MGVDIVAVSRAVPIPCKGDDSCDETHFTVGSYPKRRDGLKPGCYVKGKGGREFGFRAGSYIGYSDWRKTLCLLALGVVPQEVWEHPRRFQGKPFVELIDVLAHSRNWAFGRTIKHEPAAHTGSRHSRERTGVARPSGTTSYWVLWLGLPGRCSPTAGRVSLSLPPSTDGPP
jgi:hypothetical protein